MTVPIYIYIYIEVSRNTALPLSAHMAGGNPQRARLVADPSIGVSDLQQCICDFIDESSPQRLLNLYDFVLKPAGTSWKTVCNAPWLSRLSPLLAKYLDVAPNGVLPSKRHKAAVIGADEQRSLNKTKKSADDFADIIDDSIRMALAHLRGLKLYDSSRVRAFRKMDICQQNTIQKLLDKLMVVAEPSAEPSSIAEKPNTSDSCLDLVVLEPGHVDKGGDGDIEMSPDRGSAEDPKSIFQRILRPNPSNGSEGSFGSVPAPERASNQRKQQSPKGFLPGLLEEEDFLDKDEAKMIEACKEHCPPVKKGNCKAKVASKKKAASGNGDSSQPPSTPKKPGPQTPTSATTSKTPPTPKTRSMTASKTPTPKKRVVRPDSELDRAELRHRLVSRAYHRAFDQAIREGKIAEIAKKRGRKARQLAAEEFDRERPRNGRAEPTASGPGKDYDQQKDVEEGAPDLDSEI